MTLSMTLVHIFNALLLKYQDILKQSLWFEIIKTVFLNWPLNHKLSYLLEGWNTLSSYNLEIF
jgi:hypothetical protein